MKSRYEARNLLAELVAAEVKPRTENGPRTPGFWTAHTDKAGVTGRTEFFQITAGGVLIGRAWESRLLRHGRANARLMAASPQLLLALELTQEALELALTLTREAGALAQLQVAYQRNREAIREATAEGGQ